MELGDCAAQAGERELPGKCSCASFVIQKGEANLVMARVVEKNFV